MDFGVYCGSSRCLVVAGSAASLGFVRSAHAAKFHQRVAVRVTYSSNKTHGQWKAHGHYIARDSATQKQDIKAVGFSATETAVDVAERLASWQSAGDERMFKIIVSPEFGERMDLERHTRGLMRRIEAKPSHKTGMGRRRSLTTPSTRTSTLRFAVSTIGEPPSDFPARSFSPESAGTRRNWRPMNWDFGQNAMPLRRSKERFSNSGSRASIESFSAAVVTTRTTSQSAENRLIRGGNTRKRRITTYRRAWQSWNK